MKNKISLQVINIVAVLIVGLCSSGCFTSAGVTKYDRIAASKMLKIQPQGNNGMLVGVDLLSLNTGTFAAFEAAPVEMTARVLGDAIAAGIVVYGAYEATKGNNNDNNSASAPSNVGRDSVVINGDNNHVISGDRTDNSSTP